MPITIKISKLKIQTQNRMAKISYNPDLGKNEESILGENAITITKEKKDFSFKNIDADGENIQNPKIVDNESFDKLRNKNITLKDKSDEIDNPIYELDEDRAIIESDGAIKNKKETYMIVNRKLRSLPKNSSRKRYTNAD
jgi:hypothetical protein